MKYGLGRGIMALVDENAVENSSNNQIINININNIIPNRNQPRKVFEEDTLNDLADSIREKG